MLLHFSDHLEFALKFALAKSLAHSTRTTGRRLSRIDHFTNFISSVTSVGKREGAGPLFALWNPVIPNSLLIIKKRR
jgi:hypothetical protein